MKELIAVKELTPEFIAEAVVLSVKETFKVTTTEGQDELIKVLAHSIGTYGEQRYWEGRRYSDLITEQRDDRIFAANRQVEDVQR